MKGEDHSNDYRQIFDFLAIQRYPVGFSKKKQRDSYSLQLYSDLMSINLFALINLIIKFKNMQIIFIIAYFSIILAMPF